MTRALMLSTLLASVVHAAEPATVAIFYFDSDAKNEDLVGLRKGLTQMLITDLAGRDTYTLVERVRLQEGLAEFDLAKSQKVDPATALKLGRLLNAKFIVLGGFFPAVGQLRIDARVFEVETSKLIKGVFAQGKVDDFFALEQKLAIDLDAVLAKAAAKAEEAPPPRPPSALARSAKGKVPLKDVVAYSKALDLKDAKDPTSAKAQLEAVVKANPDFLLARLDLAELAK